MSTGECRNTSCTRPLNPVAKSQSPQTLRTRRAQEFDTPSRAQSRSLDRARPCERGVHRSSTLRHARRAGHWIARVTPLRCACDFLPATYVWCVPPLQCVRDFLPATSVWCVPRLQCARDFFPATSVWCVPRLRCACDFLPATSVWCVTRLCCARDFLPATSVWCVPPLHECKATCARNP